MIKDNYLLLYGQSDKLRIRQTRNRGTELDS